MNLRDLEYLVALEETRHFRKAAEKCFVSQPGLSTQIKKLEEELGIQLVERTPRHIIFTSVGKAIVEQAQQVLSQVGELKLLAKNFERPLAGPLHLGVIPTLAPYLIPLMIPLFKQQFPHWELYLYEVQTNEMVSQILEGRLDLGLLALPDGEGLEKHVLFNEAFWLAVSPSHPLAERKMVTLKDLQHQELLLLREGHCFRQQVIDLCAQAQAHYQPYFHANSLEILRQMVASGGGITLIPELAVKQETQQLHSWIRYIPFESPVPQRTIAMVFRSTSFRKTGFLQVGDLIKSQVESF